MIANLLAELFGGARQLTTGLLAAIALIYLSGFVIVNAYLLNFGIVRIELFHPTFIAAGLLFVFIALLGICFSLPVAAGVSVFLDLTHSVWKEQRGQNVSKSTETRDSNGATNASHLEAKAIYRELRNWVLGLLLRAPLVSRSQKWLWRLISRESRHKLPALIKRLILLDPYFDLEICLSLTGTAFIVGVLLSENVATLTLSILFRDLLDTQIEQKNLITVLVLHGIVSTCVLLVFSYNRRLGSRGQPVSHGIVAIIFLFTQVYTLLKVAGDLYGALPASIGGGKLTTVQFLVDESDKSLLETLGVRFNVEGSDQEKEVAVSSAKAQYNLDRLQCTYDENNGAMDSSCLVATKLPAAQAMTEEVFLLWSISGPESSTYVVVLPCRQRFSCPRPTVEFDKRLVLGILYISPQTVQIP